jgi:hypothetical protein
MNYGLKNIEIKYGLAGIVLQEWRRIRNEYLPQL